MIDNEIYRLPPPLSEAQIEHAHTGLPTEETLHEYHVPGNITDAFMRGVIARKDLVHNIAANMQSLHKSDSIEPPLTFMQHLERWNRVCSLAEMCVGRLLDSEPVAGTI